MRFLLDTNCWMQLVRGREHAAEVGDLLRAVPPSDVCISDYALHSLINITRRHKVLDDLPAFIRRSGFGVTVEVVSVLPAEFGRIVAAVNRHGLDVDDAYQYVAAELHGLKLVSLDADFDRTPNGRLTPAAALQAFKDEQQQPPQQPSPPAAPQDRGTTP
jgi:predicted nucleic acid-binding protein